MSFLLDALKKSEQERQQYQVPNLQTHHVSIARYGYPWRWFSVFAVFLVVNIALYFWFFAQETQKTVDIPHSNPVTAAVIVPESHQPEDALPLLQLQDASPSTLKVSKARPVFEQMMPEPMNHERQTSEQQVQHASSRVGGAVLSLEQLSPQQRKHIGHLNILAHFYGRDPQSRIVMINGITWHEGQNIRPHLTLETITEKGLILNDSGLRFSMQAFQVLKP